MTDNLSKVGRIPDRRRWLVLVVAGAVVCGALSRSGPQRVTAPPAAAPAPVPESATADAA